ncbi:hypothetical protein APSETT444_003607 [Aspergillus pseudonomiae]
MATPGAEIGSQLAFDASMKHHGTFPAAEQIPPHTIDDDPSLLSDATSGRSRAPYPMLICLTVGRPGLSKKYEDFHFFRILNVERFKSHLSSFIPHITDCEKAMQDKGLIRQHKIAVAQGTESPKLLDVVGVNISFTSKGLALVGHPEQMM